MGHDSSLHDVQTTFSDFLSTGGAETKDLVVVKWKPRVVLISLMTDPVLETFCTLRVSMATYWNLLSSYSPDLACYGKW